MKPQVLAMWRPQPLSSDTAIASRGDWSSWSQGGLLLLWVFTLFAVVAFVWRRWNSAARTGVDGGCKPGAWEPELSDMVVIYTAGSVLWWLMAGQFDPRQIASVVASSLAALAIGTLIGFVFTAYSQEKETVGKVRDWLLGGLTGLGIAEFVSGAEHVRDFVQLFASGGTPYTVGVHVANMLVYGTLGFFALLVLRKTRWNEMFMHKDIELRRLEEKLRRMGERAGPEDRDELPIELGRQPRREPEPAVQREANEAVRAMTKANISIEDLAPADRLKLARAQLLAGRHPDAMHTYEQLLVVGFDTARVAKELADVYWRVGRYRDAAAVIERHRSQIGGAAMHLLGYYLLWVRDRLKDALRYSEAYLAEHAHHSATLINKACALAQLAELEGNEQPEYRRSAIETLRRAVELDAQWRSRIAELSMAPGDDFYSLRSDAEFRKIVDGDAGVDSRGEAAGA